MSHTVKINIELRNREALAAALQAMGAQVYGEGTHQLFAGPEVGFGFQLPGWHYPLVARADGTLAYDDYHGSWGNVADLDALREEYALEAVRTECANLGWLCESSNTGGLIVYHPDGGTLSVTRGGSIDAAGFMGSGCAEASAKLEAALGRRTEQTLKPEYQLGQIEVGQGEE